MYKILIKTRTASNNIWNFYQQDEVDYTATSLEDMKPIALTLLKQYGKKSIKIIDQISGQDGPVDFLDWMLQQPEADYLSTVEDYMRISDYLDVPPFINEENYEMAEVKRTAELIDFYYGGENHGE